MLALTPCLGTIKPTGTTGGHQIHIYSMARTILNTRSSLVISSPTHKLFHLDNFHNLQQKLFQQTDFCVYFG